MFDLDEALRRHRAARHQRLDSPVVATAVATLSPGPKGSGTRVVAAVAAVAKTSACQPPAAMLIEHLQQEGASLKTQYHALYFRPTDWDQLVWVSAQWVAIRDHLQAASQPPERPSEPPGPRHGRNAG